MKLTIATALGAAALATLSAAPAHAGAPARGNAASPSSTASPSSAARPDGALPRAGAPVPGDSPIRAGAAARGDSAEMITLTVADNGRRIAVPRGEHVMVQLKVDGRDADRSTWWRPITETGPALQSRVVGTMIPSGVTAGHYYAVRRGRATLSSARAVCPPTKNSRTCFAMQGWSVTVDVR